MAIQLCCQICGAHLGYIDEERAIPESAQGKYCPECQRTVVLTELANEIRGALADISNSLKKMASKPFLPPNYWSG